MLIVIPKANDSANYVYGIFSKMVGKDVAKGFKNVFYESGEMSDFMRQVNLEGFEFANYSVRRTDYESMYTIVYYTSD